MNLTYKQYQKSGKLRLNGYSCRLSYWIFYRWQGTQHVDWLAQREQEIIEARVSETKQIKPGRAGK